SRAAGSSSAPEWARVWPWVRRPASASASGRQPAAVSREVRRQLAPALYPARWLCRADAHSTTLALLRAAWVQGDAQVQAIPRARASATPWPAVTGSASLPRSVRATARLERSQAAGAAPTALWLRAGFARLG